MKNPITRQIISGILGGLSVLYVPLLVFLLYQWATNIKGLAQWLGDSDMGLFLCIIACLEIFVCLLVARFNKESFKHALWIGLAVMLICIIGGCICLYNGRDPGDRCITGLVYGIISFIIWGLVSMVIYALSLFLYNILARRSKDNEDL
jgi:hypothetical protein